MRRLLVTTAIALFAAAPAQAATLGNWDRTEQRAVVRAGVLPSLADGFHGERALTPGQLQAALEKVSGRPATVPAKPVTVALFHKLVVKQLGLVDLARSVQAEAARAGLEPPSRFGTEVVARQLGLRFDHPSTD
ncbi:MAG: peptidoglycan DL-endopeptidase CwlO, partial [Thermoleophilaceae bacterium]|nr:peptidoglycan DL-endopeptidase CwlO [Thermoleophilaceae bacterium]